MRSRGGANTTAADRHTSRAQRANCPRSSGKIKKWNDTAIVATTGRSLPNEDIIVVHRSDGSGTTYIWVDYLSSVNAEWKSKVGVANSVSWPVGLGGQGNAGVAGEVKNNRNGLGYVELAYAIQNGLGVGIVKNSMGAWIDPNLASVTAAAAGALETMPDDLRVSIVNPPSEIAIVAASRDLAYRQQRDGGQGRALALNVWGIKKGRSLRRPFMRRCRRDAALRTRRSSR